MKKQLTLFEDTNNKFPDGHTKANIIFDEREAPEGDPIKRSRQKKLLWAALQGRPKTRMELAVETGIMRSSVCPVIDTWLNENRLYVVGRGQCPITGHKADMITANRQIFLDAFSMKDDPLEL